MGNIQTVPGNHKRSVGILGRKASSRSHSDQEISAYSR